MKSWKTHVLPANRVKAAKAVVTVGRGAIVADATVTAVVKAAVRVVMAETVVVSGAIVDRAASVAKARAVAIAVIAARVGSVKAETTRVPHPSSRPRS